MMLSLCSNIGNITSTIKIGNALTNEGDLKKEKSFPSTSKTISRYIDALIKALMFQSINRYEKRKNELNNEITQLEKEKEKLIEINKNRKSINSHWCKAIITLSILVFVLIGSLILCVCHILGLI